MSSAHRPWPDDRGDRRCGTALRNARVCTSGRPRLGGTPVVDEPVAAGYLRNWLWSRCACEGDHEERQFESNNLDHERPVIACKYAAHVTILLILGLCVAARGDGTTAGRVAPDRNGLVPNRRAPKSGTAARATTMFGSDPNPAMSTRARTTRAGRHTRQPGSCATRSGPSRGRRANETDWSRPRSAERAEASSASGRKLSTRRNRRKCYPAKNISVDLDRVDNW